METIGNIEGSHFGDLGLGFRLEASGLRGLIGVFGMGFRV